MVNPGAYPLSRLTRAATIPRMLKVAVREKSAAAAARDSLKTATTEEEIKTQMVGLRHHCNVAGASVSGIRTAKPSSVLRRLQASLSARLEEFAAARVKAAAAAHEQEVEVEKLTAEIAAVQAQLDDLDEPRGDDGAAGKSKAKKFGKGSSKSSSAAAAPADDAPVALSTASRAQYNTLKASERAQTADTRAALEALTRAQVRMLCRCQRIIVRATSSHITRANNQPLHRECCDAGVR